VELDIDEWLDFVRALYKIRIDRWNRFRDGNRRPEISVYFSDTNEILKFSGCDRYLTNRFAPITVGNGRSPKWSVRFGFSDSHSLWSTDNEIYPIMSKLMNGLETKILNKSGN
jgi:hypothetical protein